MPPTKRHKNFATWAGAVKDWNMNQAFKDELYGIPKKGSSFYDEVFELFYGKPVETPAPVAPAVVVPPPAPAPAKTRVFKVASAPAPAPAPVTPPAPVIKENDAITAYIEALAEIKRNDSGKIMKGMMYSMSKSELEELNKMNNEMRERSKNLKTQSEIRAFNRKERELVSKFQIRSQKRHYADEDKLAILKKASDDAKGIKQEPDVVPRGKMLSVEDSMKFLSGFARKGSAPPAKLAEMTKESEKAVDFIDDNWRGTSEVSKLPSHLRRHGFNWLQSKYGGLYLQAVRKAKQVASEGRQSFKTEKEYRDFVNIDFAEYGVDYREFFKDVLFADTQLYFYLQKNANTTKAPSYTSSAREFQKYLDKK